jgi:CHAD domain-containing protein/CYTH domain-containing protein
MPPPVTDDMLLRQPAARAVRVVALSLLDRAHAQAGRLRAAAPRADKADREDDESLHDFRVAMRRLHSWLRAWEPWLGDSVAHKTVRRIRKIARATGPARDIEVHLAWFREQRGALRGRQRAGLAWIVETLTSQWDEALSEARDAARDFESAHVRLSKQLSTYTTSVHPTPHDEPFGTALADLVRHQAGTLHHRLAAVRGFDDQAAAHRARIAAKRLRYLLEPAGTEGDGEEDESSAIIGRLKELQDVLGDLHDVHVLASQITDLSERAAAAQARREAEAALDERVEEMRRVRTEDPRPGLLALVRRLHQRGLLAFAALERDWLGDAATQFLDRVQAHADALANRASSGREIERKYLLSRLPELPAGGSSVEIEQGYLPGEQLFERLRCIRAHDGTERWFRTVKVGNGLSRIEVEDEGEPNLCGAMWPFTDGRRLYKRRHSVPGDGDRVWEIDEFLDRELVLAEVELASLHEEVELPPWVRDVLVREVTDEREFANVELARATGGV